MRPLLAAVLAVLAGLALLITAAPARGGTYEHHTLSPISPGLDGWTPRVRSPRGFAAAMAGPDGLVVSFWARPWFDPGDMAEWSYAAPPDTTVADWHVDRAVSGLLRGDWNTGFGAVADGRWRYLAADVPSVNRAWGRVGGTGLGAQRVVAHLACGGPHPCFTAGPAALRLRASRIVLHDGHAPTVSRVQGDLMEDRLLAGTSALSLTAADRGGGVYRAFVEVDGEPRTPVAIGDARCRDLVAGGDPHQFAFRRPCPLEAGATVALNTAGLADGRHVIAVRVEDAAGNATVAYGPATKVVDNVPDMPPPPPAPTPSPAPAPPARPPAGAAPRAVVTAWLEHRGRRGSALVTAYGERARLAGRVTDTAGRPLAGAPVDVADQLVDGEGRPLGPWWLGPPAWRALTGLRTRADGRFEAILEAGPSRRLRVAGPAGAPGPALAVRVRAPVTVRARRRGAGVVVRGRLAGGHLPPVGAIVELQLRRRGQRWAGGLVVRTRASGRFSGRLAWVAPGRVAARARVPRQAGLPYAAGLARAVSLPRRGGRTGPRTSR